MSDSNSKKDRPDGGPAFPTLNIARRLQGMSLRDHFAGQAMWALIAAGSIEGPGDSATEDLVAATAYGMADAMLKAREQ